MFKFIVQIEPLGLLYASSGPFLSPENLVGLASQTFPPQSPTVAGMIAASLGSSIPDAADRQLTLESLFVAGPFWSFRDRPQNFYVPTPLCYLSQLTASSAEAEDSVIPSGDIQRLTLQDRGGDKAWLTSHGESPIGKFDQKTWLPINEWENPKRVHGEPWSFLPHLHPRLKSDERCVMEEEKRGSLFLENAVQLHPDVSLIYLSSLEIEPGWYRFGGEGHLVQVNCLALSDKNQARFDQPLGHSFATITPGIWGSNRFSKRYPPEWDELDGEIQVWTERASSFRFRLGGTAQQVKRLSRGRYAVPAGTIYQLPIELEAWQHWDFYDRSSQGETQPKKSYFPTEGYSFKHWGCGLSLPIAI